MMMLMRMKLIVMMVAAVLAVAVLEDLLRLIEAMENRWVEIYLRN